MGPTGGSREQRRHELRGLARTSGLRGGDLAGDCPRGPEQSGSGRDQCVRVCTSGGGGPVGLPCSGRESPSEGGVSRRPWGATRISPLRILPGDQEGTSQQGKAGDRSPGVPGAQASPPLCLDSLPLPEGTFCPLFPSLRWRLSDSRQSGRCASRRERRRPLPAPSGGEPRAPVQGSKHPEEGRDGDPPATEVCVPPPHTHTGL